MSSNTGPAPTQRNPETAMRIVVLAAVTLLALGVAKFVPVGVGQSVLLSAGVTTGVESVRMGFGGVDASRRNALLRITLHLILVLCALLLIQRYWAPQDVRPPASSTVASFDTGKGDPARTERGDRFNVLQDCDIGHGPSRVWYERVAATDGDGRLRIHFELRATSSEIPYVGVFADLDGPPARPVDLSAFTGIEFKVPGGNYEASEVSLSVTLASANVLCLAYDYAEAGVPLPPTGPGKAIQIPFSQFVDPKFSQHKGQHPIDTSQVFRLAFTVRGTVGASPSGFIDIDDIRFY